MALCQWGENGCFAPDEKRYLMIDRKQGRPLAPLELRADDGRILGPDDFRSEEHTSELQSLMRISYAVFCLKKKKENNKKTTQATQSTTTNVHHVTNKYKG